jgi:UTP:GlnB (protein PII) uridylyltransferase
MNENPTNRMYDLVEELRADIDFELDDVISNIVRDLPEDYFHRLKRKDQLTHLKALLAISFCQLEEEIMLRGTDGRHVAVVARQNYPGLLANILKRLPTDQTLVGAKIFTSKAHDFIIDLFEFDASQNGDSELVEPLVVVNTVNLVAQKTGRNVQTIDAFVAHYPTSSEILNSVDELCEHFLANEDLKQMDVAVRLSKQAGSEKPRITIAANCLTAREVFQRSAEFLAREGLDIEQGFLNDLSTRRDCGVAISSFVLSDEITRDQEALVTGDSLQAFLRTGSAV